ncbi:MAG: PilZ domain-containing protein [Acidobacteria bacterium]|nr:PilZ domain-containing protein [Acidobacteriota bacterium]
MSATVLIAAAEQLASLKEREDLSAAQVFSDAEALHALDVITRQRPAVVALDRLFATTSRGTALINRIKADPSLSGCEIRIVTDDAGPHVAPRGRGDAAAVGAAGAAAALAVEEATPVPAAPLDQRGTRRAPRFKIADGVEVEIDGNPATLVDMSVVGAQVISSTVLRPNQRVRMLVPSGSPPVRFRAAVAWASFEIPKGTTRYRAGIEFFEVDPAALARFIDQHRT